MRDIIGRAQARVYERPQEDAKRAWMMGGECDAIDEWLVDWGNATAN